MPTGKLNLADGQTELAGGHAERQIEHADGQTERNHDHTSAYGVEWQAEWQARADDQSFTNQENVISAGIHLPDNSIKIIKNVMNIPCKMPRPPEFIFKLSESAASQNLGILKKYNNDLGKALKANGHAPLGYGSEF